MKLCKLLLFSVILYVCLPLQVNLSYINSMIHNISWKKVFYVVLICIFFKSFAFSLRYFLSYFGLGRRKELTPQLSTALLVRCCFLEYIHKLKERFWFSIYCFTKYSRNSITFGYLLALSITYNQPSLKSSKFKIGKTAHDFVICLTLE